TVLGFVRPDGERLLIDEFSHNVYRVYCCSFSVVGLRRSGRLLRHGRVKTVQNYKKLSNKRIVSGGGSLNFHSAPPFRPRTRTGNADRRRTQRSASENSAARAGSPPNGCRVGRPRRPAARCRARAGSSREQTLRKK